MFKNLYWAWEGILDKGFCDYALSRMNWEEAKDGTVRDGVGILDETKRVTQVLWEDVHTPIAAVALHFIKMANERAGWNLDILYPQNVQMGRYGPGGHYDWHMDSGIPDENNHQRKLSCSILLNDPSEYEGGMLEIQSVEKPLPTARGSIIVFPSNVQHRVSPVISGVRYSAVCWTVGPAFK